LNQALRPALQGVESRTTSTTSQPTRHTPQFAKQSCQCASILAEKAVSDFPPSPGAEELVQLVWKRVVDVGNDFVDEPVPHAPLARLADSDYSDDSARECARLIIEVASTRGESKGRARVTW
jgi:hypothetical protein